MLDWYGIKYRSRTFIHNSSPVSCTDLLDQHHIQIFVIFLGQHYWRYCLGPLVYLLPKHKIIWFSNLSTLSVPDEGCSKNTSCALNLISTFLFQMYQKLSSTRMDSEDVFLIVLTDRKLWWNCALHIRTSGTIFDKTSLRKFSALRIVEMKQSLSLIEIILVVRDRILILHIRFLHCPSSHE
jgi:hypothetical protein